MKYKVDERVGCIAVVEETFHENGLHPDTDGVIAFWSGIRDKDGWSVLDWQRNKARNLCELLNGEV